MKNWMEDAAERYPLTEEQKEQKAAIESGDDMPFVKYNNRRYYYDNNKEYTDILNMIEDDLYR